MKKIIISTLIVLFLTSCGSKKSMEINKRSLKGSWVISDITYDGFRKYDVNLFRDADSDCFKISSWDFISNNNKGSYFIKNDLCTTGKRSFIWTYDNEAEKVTIKPTDEKFNSENNVGFSFTLFDINESTMIWTQTFQIDGGPVVMKIIFNKNNE
jgi:hypothetical protein